MDQGPQCLEKSPSDTLHLAFRLLPFPWLGPPPPPLLSPFLSITAGKNLLLVFAAAIYPTPPLPLPSFFAALDPLVSHLVFHRFWLATPVDPRLKATLASLCSKFPFLGCFFFDGV